ncbi:MAG: hypothetical protein AMXMBFR82_02440 [Candidatus Hydrogenedentota bacterium]
MSDTTRKKRASVVLLVLVGVAYSAVFQLAVERRADANALAAEGNKAISAARVGAVFADGHEGCWPSLDPARRFAYAPDDLPIPYTLGHPPKKEMEEPAQALLVTQISRHAALTLEPVDNLDDYVYLGYATTSETEGMALVEALRSGAPLADAISVGDGKGTAGGSKLYRLHADLPLMLAEDQVLPDEQPEIRSRIPVLVQRPTGDHAWVVYLDLHAEYLPYPGDYPLTEEFVTAIP